MTRYALIGAAVAGVAPIVNVIEYDGTLSSFGAFAAAADPNFQAATGGSYNVARATFSPPAPPPPPPPPSVPEQAATLLAGGLAITSTATPALNGAYPCDSGTQQKIVAEVTAILLNGVFADGAASVIWLDLSSAQHTFSIPQFKTFATAVAQFVSNCLKCSSGISTTLPAATATIP